MSVTTKLKRAARALELAAEYFEEAHGQDEEMSAAAALLGANIASARIEIAAALAQLAQDSPAAPKR